MNLFKVLILLIPVFSAAYGQSKVAFSLYTTTRPFKRTTSVTVNEGETLLLCFNPLGAPLLESTLLIQSENGTASAPDDYNNIDIILDFNAGDGAEKCVPVIAFADDDDDERDEYLIVRANGLRGDYSDFEAVITITIPEDGEGGGGGIVSGITIEQVRYVVSEADESIEVCAVQNGLSFGNIGAVMRTRAVSTSAGATEGSDYTAVSQQVRFSGPGARQCIDIPIIQDDMDEGNEEFQVSLDTRNIITNRFVQPIRVAVVVITDAVTTSNTTDDATPPSEDTTPTPVTPTTSYVVLIPEDTPRMPTTPTVDVATPTPAPTTTVAMPSPTPTPTESPTMPPPKEEAFASLELSVYYTSEDANSVEVCVVVTGQLNSPATATLWTHPYTAQSPNDYTNVHEELLFSAIEDGCDRVCVNISIKEESSPDPTREPDFEEPDFEEAEIAVELNSESESEMDFEPSEYFFVLLTSTDPRVSVRGYIAMVNILNTVSEEQPRPYAVLEQSDYTISEGESLEVCAVLSADIRSTQWVSGALQTLSVSAPASAQALSYIDFSFNTQRVYFRPGSPDGTKICMNVYIMQDNEKECSEVFLVEFSDYSSPIRHWPNIAVVRILD